MELSAARRLVGVIEELSTLAHQLEPESPDPAPDPRARAAAVLRRLDEELHSHRRRRELFNPEIGPLSSPVWLMLLELSAAKLRRRPVSVSDVCLASGAAVSTAHRQLLLLEQHKLVERRRDPEDGRRCWVEITSAALEMVTGWAETAGRRRA